MTIKNQLALAPFGASRPVHVTPFPDLFSRLGYLCCLLFNCIVPAKTTNQT